MAGDITEAVKEAAAAMGAVTVDTEGVEVESRFPRLPPNVVVERRNGKYLFLDPEQPAWVVTNANGAVALKLCDGTRSVAEISRIVSKKIGSDRTAELTQFFRYLIDETRLFSAPAPFGYHPPGLRVAHLNLTDACNLNCIYCYACDRSHSGESLNCEAWFRVIDGLNRISSQITIELTGGEPLLAPYVFDVARYAREKGNRTHLLTNGTLVSRDNAPAIASLFDLVRISLDGSSPGANDYHRGAGTFASASRAVDMLAAENAAVQVSMTVTRKNIDDVGGMAARFGSLVTFAPLFATGRVRTKRGLAVTGREYYHALSSVPGINPLNCLHSCLQTALHSRIVKCAAGDAEISISSTGDVYPCHLLHLPQFLAGSTKEEPLEDIYHTSQVLKLFRNLDVRRISGCAKCDVRFICGGACRARAFYAKGRIDVSDAFCEYEKLAYTNGLFDLHELA